MIGSAVTGRWRSDAGVSIVELGVSIFIASLLAVGLVSWISSGAATLRAHEGDDAAVQDLRIAKEQMGRELRRAGSLLAAGSQSVTVWLDDDADLIVDTGERVTWAIDAGELERSTDAGESTVIMSGLNPASGFTFDASNTEDVTRIELTLSVDVGSSTRTIATEIHLRNT